MFGNRGKKLSCSKSKLLRTQFESIEPNFITVSKRAVSSSIYFVSQNLMCLCSCICSCCHELSFIAEYRGYSLQAFLFFFFPFIFGINQICDRKCDNQESMNDFGLVLHATCEAMPCSYLVFKNIFKNKFCLREYNFVFKYANK